MDGYNYEKTNGELHDLLNEVALALDQEKYFIIIGDGHRTVIVKNIPTEDVMTEIAGTIWQIPD